MKMLSQVNEALSQLSIPLQIEEPWKMEDPHVEFRDEVNWFNWYQFRMHYVQYFYFYLAAALLYYPCVRLGQRLMEKRPAFTGLRPYLFVWNVIMCIGSGVGAYFTMGYLLPDLATRSFQDQMCDISLHTKPAPTIAIAIYTMSKIFEWIDTLFLILRKKPIIFLHWFHHLVTAVYVWLGAQYNNYSDTSGYWFAGINMVVHFVMYGYYAASSVGYRMPFPFVITFLQTAQMVAGIFVAWHMPNCPNAARAWPMIGLALLMYGTYLYLFTKLFFVKLFGKKKKRHSVADSAQSKKNK